jgi:hypothetical protein
MAETEAPSTGTVAVHTTAMIPIADLSPELEDSSTKSIKAVVTLKWPYSSSSGTIALLLAEPDFRLRRAKGQVRVQFSGASAKAIARSEISSGDEVTLSLEGVEWAKDPKTTQAPGQSVDWELRFTERVVAQVSMLVELSLRVY